MSSIPAPAAPPCPSWCTDHSEDGWNVAHAGAPTGYTVADDPAPLRLNVLRTDELIPGRAAAELGTGFVTVRLPGQSEATWLTAAEARGLGCRLIELAGQAGEGVAR